MPTINIHGQPGTGYPLNPVIKADVSYSGIWRSGSTIYCNVSAVIGALPTNQWGQKFGFQLSLYAQLDNGGVNLLFTKPNNTYNWGAGAFSGATTLSAVNTGTSATLKIFTEAIRCGCSGQGTKQLMWSVNIGAPAMSPPTVTLTSAGFTANSLSWNVTTDVSSNNWKYSLDYGSYITYWGGNTTATSGYLNVTPTIHSVVVKATREGSTLEGTSNKVTWDCRLPEINNLSVSPKNNTTGTLSVSSNFNVSIYWENQYIGRVDANTMFTGDVTLQGGTLKEYNVKVVREDNNAITNNKNISVDMLYPVITLNANVNGIFIDFTAVMDSLCKDVKAEITWGNGNKYTINCPLPETSIWNYTITNINGQELNINTEYTIKIIATKVSNNVTSNSNTVKAKPLGCVRIFKDKYNANAAGVWVWTDMGGNPGNYKWTMTIPYIYDKDKGWISAR